MEVIFKYRIKIDTLRGGTILHIPKGGKVLSVQNRKDGGSPLSQITLWAQIDESNEFESRRFTVVGTGQSFHPRDHEDWKFISTVQDGPFVWHVFEILTDKKEVDTPSSE